jgi:large conductance mechanosensitive channel
MGMISEFREFAMRGNVVDLAVGVVIGAAFGKIVGALVDGVVMPLVGLMIGGVNFRDLAVVLVPGTLDAAGAEVAPVLLKYGLLIQSVVDFVIIAFAIFLTIKAMNRLKRKQEAAPEPAAQSEEVKLLTEIRDALKAP